MVVGLVLRGTERCAEHAASSTSSWLGRGILGDVVFVLVGAAACAAGIPRQAVAFAASYAFGLWPGAALALLAQAIGCLVSFGWARALGRGWAARRVRGRLARADRFLAANPFAATLVLRLLPVGNSLALNLLAGVSAVPLLPFLTASVIGYIPADRDLRPARRAEFGSPRERRSALPAALFLSSALLGLWLLRRQRQLAPDRPRCRRTRAVIQIGHMAYGDRPGTQCI